MLVGTETFEVLGRKKKKKQDLASLSLTGVKTCRQFHNECMHTTQMDSKPDGEREMKNNPI